MSEDISTEVFESIESVSRDRWDSLAGDSLGMNYGILLCRERNSKSQQSPRYFCVSQGDTLVAVSVAVIDENGGHKLMSWRLFGRLQAFARKTMKAIDRALVCGQIAAPGVAVLTRRDGDERRFLSLVCDTMEEYAAAHKVKMAYVCVQPQNALLVDELNRRGYLRATDLPIAVMTVNWTDTRSYLKFLKSRSNSHASAAKKEMRRFEKAGASIRRFNESDYTELMTLLDHHSFRKNSRDLRFSSNILADLREELGDRCLIFVAEKDNELIGVLVTFTHKEDAWAWIVGINHELAGDSFCYFNLNFYYPAILYARLGVKRVYYGNAVQYAKFRRGCDILETDIYLMTNSNLLDWCMRPVFWLQRKYFTRKYGTALNKVGPSAT